MVARSLLTDWNASNDGSHYVYAHPLERPDSDDREYRLVRLANQLEVLLISDPETDRASAALDVHVGNLSDPVRKNKIVTIIIKSLFSLSVLLMMVLLFVIKI